MPDLPKKRRALPARFGVMGLLLCCVVIVSFSLGRYTVAPADVIRIVLAQFFLITKTWPHDAEIVLFSIRLPRLITGVLAGAGLSMAGGAFQAVFSNPMVSPDVLGATSGAGFGAALAILLSFNAFGISLTAFFFGLLSVLLVVVISGKIRKNRLLSLILTGMVVGSLFSAGLSFLKLVADPQNELPAITYWLMGSLNGLRLKDLSFAAPLICLGSFVLILLRWQLNLLVLGDEEARALGVPVTAVRLTVIFSSTLITAASVAVSGMIGWIGLIVPHAARLTVGSDHRYALPAAGFLGAIFLVLVDNVARLAATSEIPLGILTSFIGAPFFLWLILRESKS